MESFNDRAQQMGLDISGAYKGLYKYTDRYSEVVYRQLITDQGPNGVDEDPTDGLVTPIMGIYTKASNSQEYNYIGYVSNMYKFIGNDVLNQRIRESILSIGMPIMIENTVLSNGFCKMRTEMIIQNGQQVANVGDVLPVMIVQNSYDGSRAASVAFGISTLYNQERIVFAFNLGEMRQVHIATSNTSLSTAINSYISVFSENITDVINQSFASQIAPEQMLGVLDMLEESFGKKRRDKISSLLEDIQTSANTPLPSAWQMFLAIVRYSSLEPNLNIKRLLENAAESVLVIPQRMIEVLERLNG